MAYEWNFNVVWASLPFLLGGIALTVALTVISMLGATVIGALLCAARVGRNRVLSIVATAYIDFFRATPLLVQIFMIFYGLALTTGIALPAFVAGVLALALNIGAYVAEIFRSGLQSVGAGQREAALSLGLTPAQIARRITVPQAVRYVIPPMGSTWVSTFKDSSLVSVIGVSELLFRAQVISIESYRPVEVYTVLALLYFGLTYPQARAVDWLYNRVRVR